MNSKTKHLLAHYIHLQDSGRAEPITVTDSFWPDLADGKLPALEQGRLVLAFSFAEPWANWECHPAGEEVVVLLSGAVDMVLQEPTGETCIALRSVGDFVLVPQGVWHTARTEVQSTLLFITPGQGTVHKAVMAE